MEKNKQMRVYKRLGPIVQYITAPDYGNLRFIDVHAQNHTLLSLIVIHSTSDPINLHICNEIFFGNLNDIYCHM